MFKASKYILSHVSKLEGLNWACPASPLLTCKQVFVPTKGIPFLRFKAKRWNENVPKNGGCITQVGIWAHPVGDWTGWMV